MNVNQLNYLKHDFYLVFSGHPLIKTFHLSHLAITYSALYILKTIDLQIFHSLNKEKIINSILSCMNENGIFKLNEFSHEADIRFTYSAIASISLLDGLHTVTKKSLIIESIQKCQNVDGGFGLLCNLESHCGATFCAIESLRLLNALDDMPNKEKTIHFLYARQSEEGVNGRIGKIPDSCYLFWIGASLKTLGMPCLNEHKLQNFITTVENLSIGVTFFTHHFNWQTKSQNVKQGFSKYPNDKPDLIHTALALSGIIDYLQNQQHEL